MAFPFIGSSAYRWCKIIAGNQGGEDLQVSATATEDFEGGIISVVGMELPKHNRVTLSPYQEPSSPTDGFLELLPAGPEATAPDGESETLLPRRLSRQSHFHPLNRRTSVLSRSSIGAREFSEKFALEVYNSKRTSYRRPSWPITGLSTFDS